MTTLFKVEKLKFRAGSISSTEGSRSKADPATKPQPVVSSERQTYKLDSATPTAVGSYVCEPGNSGR